jgi:hypothetical protein
MELGNLERDRNSMPRFLCYTFEYEKQHDTIPKRDSL